ncbi:MAG: hypothetical protein HQK63_06365 [Desulfamplus sp.]|nr:hypothetical protein [Desulfamplus sp.]
MMMMTLQQREHESELALIVALPLMIMNIDRKSVKGKRIGGILDRLTKHTVKAAKRNPAPVHPYDRAYCLDRLSEFFDAMNWSDKDKVDVRMMMSFLLGLIEESYSYYPQSIVDALNDGFERLSKEDEEDVKYIREAEKALTIWRQGFKKYMKEAA